MSSDNSIITAKIAAKIEATRKDLLDLSLRNSLINYRPSRWRGLEAVDELPAQIFRMLVLDKKNFSFKPDPTRENETAWPTVWPELPPNAVAYNPAQDKRGVEAAPTDNEGVVSWETDLARKLVAERAPSAPKEPTPLVETPLNYNEAELDKRYTDRNLQTNLGAGDLQNRLLKTFYDARTSIQEQGVNILYLALGLLIWNSSDDKEKDRYAPLILIPVELSRSDIRARFQLRYTEGDIGTNLSLAAKLESEFELKLPELPEADDLDVNAYFAVVEEAIKPQAGWKVDREAIKLAFFSFGKFLLYKDLAADSWAENKPPANHPILRAILADGFNEPPNLVGEGENLDHHLTPTALNLVMDADSSQTLAVLDVNAGRNLVIHGPPGTGKSQTITNLIAEAVANGKTVLFVAEKIDALKVVKNRLDSTGLGEACLELHSHKANKKEVLAELAQTLNTAEPLITVTEQKLALLTTTRNRLNAYAEEVNQPIGQSDWSPYQIMGELLQLKQQLGETSLPHLDLPGIEKCSQAEIEQHKALLREIEILLARIGIPAQHPLSASRRVVYAPSDTARLKELLTATITAMTQLGEVSNWLANSLKLPSPTQFWQTQGLQRIAQRAADAPDLSGINLLDSRWLTHGDKLNQIFAAGGELNQLYSRYNPIFVPDAWTHDVTKLRSELAETGGKWWRGFSGKFKQAQADLTALLRIPVPRELKHQLELLDGLIRIQQIEQFIAQQSELGAILFGSQWQARASNWGILASLTYWVGQLRREVASGNYPSNLLNFLANPPDMVLFRHKLTQLGAAMTAYRASYTKVIELLDLDEKRQSELDYHQQFIQLQGWQTHADKWQEIVGFNRLRQSCLELGISPLAELASTWEFAPTALGLAYQQNLWATLLDRAYRERATLAAFERESHQEAITRFREQDYLTLAFNRERVARAHWERVAELNGIGKRPPMELAFLRNEIGKKMRHAPIRKLLHTAGWVVQVVKPVFMMSPLSVATYLAPGSLEFDLVIFDEASQVKPADAFGAILRGKQVIVAGDDKQLPPTSFFDSLTGQEGDVPEDEQELDTTTGDFESILTLFKAKTLPRLLRWHYRSRHQSLIAVSNAEFYENKLIVFPSPEAVPTTSGLIYRYLPDTVYDRSRSRTNLLEAQAVAQAVMEHARTQPQLSLGVAAFSTAQRDAIRDGVEALRRQDPSCEDFFADAKPEPFFVKNLETVQGDERDVMFISIGYGRDRDGKVTMNFGPLNGKGGERRLNVLITRAKVRCEVFTNLTADDINLNQTASKGVRALKIYLGYARSGKLLAESASKRGSQARFETMVQAALEAHGYQVDRQVGQGGYCLDMAVRDPQQPERYLLGIEFDGASYYQAQSARDRDRLRPTILENLGWKLHRAWSSDWYHHPDEALARLLSAVNSE